MEVELGAGDEVPVAESFLFLDLLLESLARESCSCYVSQLIRECKTRQRERRQEAAGHSRWGAYHSLFETLHLDSLKDGLYLCFGIS